MDRVIAVAVRSLETIFMVGLAGSSVVLVMTLFEDAKSLIPRGEKKESETPTLPRPQIHASPVS